MANSEQEKLRDERQKAELASNLKIGPKVFDGPNDSGVLVRNWIEGEELTPSSGAEFTELAAQLCNALKTLHQSSSTFTKDWDIMMALEGFRRRLNESERTALMENSLVDTLREIHTRLSDGADRVPCHNDCFPKNWVRESSETSRILLIDFEYAGNNYAEFDLATLWNEFELHEASGLDLIVQQYYGKRASGLEQKRARILLNALLVDGVWAHYAACMKSSEIR
ncbi:MAG: phosphotransferase, partial [Verrucomicrobiae bacterium]|nr:phosphotransferase [Verrucomicrobiae bacterium]